MTDEQWHACVVWRWWLYGKGEKPPDMTPEDEAKWAQWNATLDHAEEVERDQWRPGAEE